MNTIYAKETDFQKVDLKDIDTIGLEYYSLTDDLTEFVKEELIKHKVVLLNEDLNVFYSLSNCQGDGLTFIGNFLYKGLTIKITHNNRYNYCGSEDMNWYEYKGKYTEYDEMSSRLEKEIGSIFVKFKEIHSKICEKAEKFGYVLIEEENISEICRYAFREWTILNAIELEDKELWNYDYSTKKKKGYWKIAEGNNSYIKGLWIEPIKLKKVVYTLEHTKYVEGNK